MVLNFEKTLEDALEKVGFKDQESEHLEFVIHEEEKVRPSFKAIADAYDAAIKEIITYLNERYKEKGWPEINLEDLGDIYQELRIPNELFRFLKDAGSNSMYYSEFHAPYKVHIWAGKDSIVAAVEQKGQGFNAEEVDNKRLITNGGLGFNVFRGSKSTIFFDNPQNATTVYIEYKFPK